ncbi:MAG: sel1 repeat family protein [Polyangiaceae bacterium]|nr:sel1 repeat family protein [Polyangiaceae bacterium]
MRRAILFGGGAAIAIGAALLALVRLSGDPRSEPHRAAPAAQPAQSTEAPLPRGMDARILGFRLLSIADRAEVLAGMEALKKAAEQGDVEAQISLGRILLQGVPAVPKDAPRAREWFLKAAPSRHPSAAYFLGIMSQSGQGVEANPAEAARWFEIAAEGGSPDAMFQLANAYRAGAGVPKNDKKAVELYEKAGEMEHPAALQTLAMAYMYGELGLKPDPDEQRRYMMAAEHAVKHRPVPP